MLIQPELKYHLAEHNKQTLDFHLENEKIDLIKVPCLSFKQSI